MDILLDVNHLAVKRISFSDASRVWLTISAFIIISRNWHFRICHHQFTKSSNVSVWDLVSYCGKFTLQQDGQQRCDIFCRLWLMQDSVKNLLKTLKNKLSQGASRLVLSLVSKIRVRNCRILKSIFNNHQRKAETLRSFSNLFLNCSTTTPLNTCTRSKKRGISGASTKKS